MIGHMKNIISCAVLLEDLKTQFIANNGDYDAEDYWEYKLGAFYEPKQEKSAEIALIWQRLENGFFPKKETEAMKKFLTEKPTRSPAERQALHRAFERYRIYCQFNQAQ